MFGPTRRQLSLGGVPSLAVYDGLMVVPDQYLFLPALIQHLFVAQVVRRYVFLLKQIPRVFFVAQNTQDHHSRPLPCGGFGRHDSGFVQLPGDHVGTLPLIQKFVVNQPHYLGLFWIHGDLSTMNIKPIDGVVAEHHPGLHAALLPPFHPLGGLAGFLLGHAGHDGQAQFSVVVPCVDVVVDENDPDAQAFQLPGVFQGIYCVPGETGYLLGEDQVEPAQLGLGDHAVERLPLAGAGAGNALVGVNLI